MKCTWIWGWNCTSPPPSWGLVEIILWARFGLWAANLIIVFYTLILDEGEWWASHSRYLTLIIGTQRIRLTVVLKKSLILYCHFLICGNSGHAKSLFWLSFCRPFILLWVMCRIYFRQVAHCCIVYTRSVLHSILRNHICLSCHVILSTHTSSGHSRSCNPSTNRSVETSSIHLSVVLQPLLGLGLPQKTPPCFCSFCSSSPSCVPRIYGVSIWTICSHLVLGFPTGLYY